MPKTIVRCSKAGCRVNADSKIAAQWRAGKFAELKTFGYACNDHVQDVIDYAKHRPQPLSVEPNESVDPIGRFDLPPQ